MRFIRDDDIIKGKTTLAEAARAHDQGQRM